MPTISSLIVFDVLLKKRGGECLALEGIPYEHITRRVVENPGSPGQLDAAEALNRDNWLFHVRAPKGVECVLVKDRVVIPTSLECFYVNKKAFPEGTKFDANAVPFPQEGIDELDRCMCLAEYPFCRAPGGVWDLITMAERAENVDKDFNRSIELYKQVIAIDPTNATAFCHIGMSHMEKNENDEAERWLRKALDLDAGITLAAANLGVLFSRKADAYMATSQPDKAWEAVKEGLFYADDRESMWTSAAFVAYRTGRSREILPGLKLAAFVNKETWKSLLRVYCIILMDLGMPGQVLAMLPYLGEPDTWTPSIASVIIASMQLAGLFQVSLDTLKKLVDHDSNTVNLITGIAFDCGEIEEALIYHNKSWSEVAKNEDIMMCNGVNRLFISNYSTKLSEEEIFAVHREWGQAMMALVSASPPRLPPPPDVDMGGRKKVIGFIGADFREHAVMMFAYSLVCGLDKEKYVTHVFSNNPSGREDDVTRGIIKSIGQGNYHSIHKMPAEEAVELIRSCRVQILVDLAGHTAGTRLNIMARKPAPVQLTMIGYPNTTGLPREVMGYRVVDGVSDPVGSGADERHTEKLIRVTGCFTCYAPPCTNGDFKVPLPPSGRDPEIGPAFVFGSYAKLPKISEFIWKAWAEILRRAPDSLLRLKTKIFSDPQFLATFKKKLKETHFKESPETVDKRILCMPYRTQPESHLRDYGRMDLMLDTAPYAGTTTTCESLSMGVSVLTLKGPSHRQNVSASIIANSGMPDYWICGTVEEYIERAVGFANKPGLLMPREDVRRLFFAGSVTKPDLYVRKIEKEVFDVIC
jgi:predicted O-linked N-acetylglucosamine transferase (SPINDLY family)